VISEVSKVLSTDDNIVVASDKLEVLHLHVEAEDVLCLTHFYLVCVRTTVLLVTHSEINILAVTYE